MSGVSLYTLILSFASGIFIRSFFEIGWTWCLWMIVVAGGLVLVGRRKSSAFAAPYVVACGIALLGFGLGIMRLVLVSEFVPAAVLAPQVGEKGTFTGQVVREPEVRAQSTNLTVQVGNEYILVKTDRHSPVRYGDAVQLFGKLALPKPFVTDLGREFDYPGYLAAQGITYTLAFGSITVMGSSAGNPVLKKLFAAKQQFMHALELVIPEPEVGLGEGLLLGVKQALGTDIETAFRRSGIIHIVVLSGYNIMIIVNFVMLLLTFALPLRARIVVGIISIILFALLVGTGASVVRASIMATLGLLALGLGRQYAVMRALFVAGTLMLVVNPLLLVHDVGFQLSFMATLGLIVVAPQLEGFRLGTLRYFGVKEFLIATLATQIAVLPLLLYQIGQFSLIAIVVNVLVLPVVSFAMFGTFVTGCVALVSPALAVPFAAGTYVLLTYIIVVATRFASLSFAAFEVPAFPFICVPLLYAAMGYFLYRRLRTDSRPVLATTSEVDDWIIEEESAVLAVIPKRIESGRGHSPRPPQSEPPIFFR